MIRKTFSDVCRCRARTSQLPNLQQADDNETSAWSVSIYLSIRYSSFWRGLTALSILCDVGNAKAFGSRMGKETDSYAFFVCLNKLTTNRQIGETIGIKSNSYGTLFGLFFLWK